MRRYPNLTAGPTGSRWRRLRWRIAELCNRSARTCWVDLVDWTFYEPENDPDEDREHKLRYSLHGGARCQAKSAIKTMCYCGKFVNGCSGKAADAERSKLEAF